MRTKTSAYGTHFHPKAINNPPYAGLSPEGMEGMEGIEVDPPFLGMFTGIYCRASKVKD